MTDPPRLIDGETAGGTPDELFDVVKLGVERSAPAFDKAPADKRQ